MYLLKKLPLKKDKPIQSYHDFWDWFLKHEQKFYRVIKSQGNIHKEFFDLLAPKLNEIKTGFWFLTGMYNDDVAELIITADGVIKNIVFVEELIAASPELPHWKFTALKQPSETNQYGLELDGYIFDESTLSFYPINHPTMPDEIDIAIVHNSLTENNVNSITNGVYISLDNALGELNAITMIDNLTIVEPPEDGTELIPIVKLRDYLIWREKEFVEKYQGFRHDTENDNYSGLEAKLKNGMPLVAVVNTDLLYWDSKASHPWIASIELKYDGADNNGMPDEMTYELLNEVEEEIMKELIDAEGYLNIGRETADNLREVYFACREFRKPSKVLNNIQERYKGRVDMDFDIYKDKYWQSFNRFVH